MHSEIIKLSVTYKDQTVKIRCSTNAVVSSLFNILKDNDRMDQAINLDDLAIFNQGGQSIDLNQAFINLKLNHKCSLTIASRDYKIKREKQEKMIKKQQDPVLIAKEQIKEGTIKQQIPKEEPIQQKETKAMQVIRTQSFFNVQKFIRKLEEIIFSIQNDTYQNAVLKINNLLKRGNLQDLMLSQAKFTLINHQHQIDITRQIEAMKAKELLSNKHYQESLKQNKAFKLQIIELNDVIAKLKEEISALMSQKAKISQQLQSKQTKINVLSQKIVELADKVHIYEEEKKVMSQTKSEIHSKKSLIIPMSHFIQEEEELFYDYESSINYFQQNYNIGQDLYQELKFKLAKSVTGFKQLYEYNAAASKKKEFSQYLEGGKNILFITKTQKGKTIGSYINSIASEEPDHLKSFIFTKEKNLQMKTFQLKPGCNAFEPDRDYIVFGNEQICIQKHTNRLVSSVPRSSGELSYNYGLNQRETFLSNEKHQEVLLERYEFLALEMSECVNKSFLI